MSSSLYLVGSKARGDDNIHSDIDYVCIYDETRPVFNLPSASSVSYYSISRMKWMINNSKLFVKHLIQEGKPVWEQEHHHCLLDSFSVDFSILRRDRDEFFHFIHRLEWIPPGVHGLRWGCDYIYTIARNIIYISNAISGFYHFGYVDAVNYFLEKKDQAHLAPLFMHLRNEKYRYRSGDNSESTFSISQLDDILLALTDAPIKLVDSGFSQLSYPTKISYELLRLVERAIINGEIEDEGYIQKLKNHGEYFFALRQYAERLAKKISEQKS